LGLAPWTCTHCPMVSPCGGAHSRHYFMQQMHL
jgi:hypothetical protein